MDSIGARRGRLRPDGQNDQVFIGLVAQTVKGAGGDERHRAWLHLIRSAALAGTRIAAQGALGGNATTIQEAVVQAGVLAAEHLL